MTPEQHAKAIEDAARKVTQASIDYMVDSGLAYKLGRAEAALQSAIRAGVGAAPPKDSAEFALAALVAAGHVSQSKVDEALALMPEGGYVPKTAPDVVAELEEVKTVCAQAYQVVGSLLSDAGRFDSPEAEKILDNLGEQRLRHTDVLPWESKPAPEGWQPIATAPKDMDQPVVVRWMDSDGPICHDLDYTEDGCWQKWNDHAEHVHIIGGHGVSYTPPYTHWMQLPPAPKP